jgi:hypothetical protein
MNVTTVTIGVKMEDVLKMKKVFKRETTTGLLMNRIHNANSLAFIPNLKDTEEFQEISVLVVLI